MSLDTLFPSKELTPAEEDHLIGVFSDPVVIKYLAHLGTEDSKELLSMGALDMSADAIARRHQYLTGKLAVLTTLLSIPRSVS